MRCRSAQIARYQVFKGVPMSNEYQFHWQCSAAQIVGSEGNCLHCRELLRLAVSLEKTVFVQYQWQRPYRQ